MQKYKGQTVHAHLKMIGALKLKQTTKSASATLTVAEAGLILASADNITLTLPAASSNAGLEYIVKATASISTGVTIDGNGSETIDGSTTQVIYSQYEVLRIVCNGTGWHIL